MPRWIVSHYKCSKCGEVDSDKILEGGQVLIQINCFNCHGVGTMNLKASDAPYESSGYADEQTSGLPESEMQRIEREQLAEVNRITHPPIGE
jgi:mono/diheme cytochrome c family protein